MNSLSLSAADGQQQFLQLLVTQLQHQDPFEPMEQTDFLAQLGQFSSLEGIQQLNANFEDLLALEELSEGASLLGRTVVFADPETGEEQTETVESVRVEEGRVRLTADGHDLAIDQISALIHGG